MTNMGYKCVTLKGELEDLGKHILLPFGTTLCGLPTPDTIGKFPQLEKMKDMISEYTEEKEWDITCEKCIGIFSMMNKKYNDSHRKI